MRSMLSPLLLLSACAVPAVPCPAGWYRAEEGLCLLAPASLTIATAEDAAEFCATFDGVRGDVVFSDEGATDLSALSCLRWVGGDLVLADHAILNSVELPALARVQGAIRVYSNPSLESISFPALDEVGADLGIEYNGRLRSISAPLLEDVGSDLWIYQSAAEIPLDQANVAWDLSFPSLASVGRHCYVRLNSHLESLDLSELRRVGGLLKFTGNDQLVRLYLTELRSVGGLWFSFGSELQHVDLPALTDVGGDIFHFQDTALRTLSMPVLREVPALEVLENRYLPVFEAPALESIQFTLDVHDNPGIVGLSLPALAMVGQDFRVRSNPNLATSQIEALALQVGDGIGGTVVIEGNGPD